MTREPITKDIHIDAPPRVVFQFLTDPVKMLRWMGVRADLKPEPGGIYFLDPNGRDVIRGSYLEVVPDSRVVFTWGWDQAGHPVPAGSTVVDITLEAEGAGTRLRLVHRELPPEARVEHEFGWSYYLARLKTVSEGGDPGVDRCADPAVGHREAAGVRTASSTPPSL